MDSDRQKLDAIEQMIKDLITKKFRLKRKEHRETISDEEAIVLDGIEEMLAEAKDNKMFYRKIIETNETPVSKTFREADSDWIKAVTGVDTAYREWTDFVADESIYPRPGF